MLIGSGRPQLIGGRPFTGQRPVTWPKSQARVLVQQRIGQDVTASVAQPFAEADRLLLTAAYRAAQETPATRHRSRDGISLPGPMSVSVPVQVASNI
ncbi:hypothetical protein GCM10010254_60940 [Streptomyces chromofuscus]|nr:hypothetical protein GCM10010254_60940 [Streptomyces chromofuscus]